LQSVGEVLNRQELLFSFRSSSGILRLVDAMMLAASSGASPSVTHRAFHSDLPGRVDLWPFLETPEKPEKPVWHDPVDTPAKNDPALALASQIAAQIKQILDDKTVLKTSKGYRFVQPGDFLILVQRRSDLFRDIIKALKTAGLPVAGADRLHVGAELAVRDLTAVLSFLETPEDDLSLACALRSPLLRLSERDLFAIAHGRKGWLWATLRDLATEYPNTLEILNDLRDQTDFLRPYELLERILTKHAGRANLIARLGRTAEEGIDALLSQALDYEQMEPPSLTGFLGWMSTDDSDIKRQMDTQSRQIRVMTVHGAKGLESPIVILPDTAKRNLPKGDSILMLDDGLACWKLAEAATPPIMRDAVEARKVAQSEERLRLLYVAMTRAENWLIVCGAGDQGKKDSWYNLIEAATSEMPAENFDFPTGAGRRYQFQSWDHPIPADISKTEKPALALPDWATSPAPAAVHPVKPVSPSDLGGAKIVSGASSGLDEAAAKQRGTDIHALLEHLPAVAAIDRWDAAGYILSNDTTETELPGLLCEVAAVLDNPDLAFLFAPDTLAEVAISASMDGVPLFGFIDRLVIDKDRILAVDFKSNSQVPATPAETPDGILRQMAAYAAGLAEIWPDHRIDTAILWTRTATLMALPHELVTDARYCATIFRD